MPRVIAATPISLFRIVSPSTTISSFVRILSYIIQFPFVNCRPGGTRTPIFTVMSSEHYHYATGLQYNEMMVCVEIRIPIFSSNYDQQFRKLPLHSTRILYQTFLMNATTIFAYQHPRKLKSSRQICKDIVWSQKTAKELTTFLKNRTIFRTIQSIDC